jgi:hypothetical protein
MANFSARGVELYLGKRVQHLNLMTDAPNGFARSLCGQRLGVQGAIVKLWTPGTIATAHQGVTCDRCLKAIARRRRDSDFKNKGNPPRATWSPRFIRSTSSRILAAPFSIVEEPLHWIASGGVGSGGSRLAPQSVHLGKSPGLSV